MFERDTGARSGGVRFFSFSDLRRSTSRLKLSACEVVAIGCVSTLFLKQLSSTTVW